MSNTKTYSPIGIFDSGFGGLTILKDIRKTLPDYDYLFLGDNARAPYGSRSFDIVYRFTLQAVKYLFSQGVIAIVVLRRTLPPPHTHTHIAGIIFNTRNTILISSIVTPSNARVTRE